jgi:FkbM family methyltransferase
MAKILHFFKKWGNDYTYTIYFLKLAGAVLTIIYYGATLLNKQKTKNFNRNINPFVLERNKRVQNYLRPRNDAFDAKFLKNGVYLFKDLQFPSIKNTYLMSTVYDDSLKVYTEYDDNYSYTIVDDLDKIIPEGTYCYISKKGERITVEKGYTVIDAGAWVGDFSIYAAKKGANVYAFEPSPTNQSLLEKSINLNPHLEGRVTIVPLGLGEKKETLAFSENDEEGNSGGSSFNIKKADSNTTLEVTTLDDWVRENNIKKVDFIKSDIEGFERHFLRGATNVLKNHSPILSICTYHLPDDKEVLKKIILDANPKYIFIQRKMKMFGYVPK